MYVNVYINKQTKQRNEETPHEKLIKLRGFFVFDSIRELEEGRLRSSSLFWL